MATAVADLHARLTADVTPYEGAMKRAGDSTRRAAADISGQMDQLQRNIARKFTLGDIGKDLLKGFGIGSGFALAQTVGEMATKHYKEQAEYAEMIEKRTAKSLEHTKAMISLGQSPEQRVDTAAKDRAEAITERNLLMEGLRVSIPQFNLRGERIADKTGQRNETAEESKRVAELDTIIQRADALIKQDEAGKRAQVVADIEKDVKNYLKNALEPQLKAEHAIREATSKRAGAVHELAEAHRRLQEVLRVDEINLGAGRSASQVRGEIGEDDAAHGRQALRDMHQEKIRNLEDYAGRIGNNSVIRADSMTSRGMGMGANYGAWQKQGNDLLKQIDDTLKRIERQGPAGYAN